MTINGQSSFNFSYDGIVSKDTGSNSGNYAAPGLDSIAEVKVQSSNFQAEYGRSSGASITVVDQERHEQLPRHGGLLQARRRLQRRTRGTAAAAATPPRSTQFGVANPNCSKPPYRFDNPTYTFGGPRQAAERQAEAQAVLLLVAGHPAAHRPRQPEQQHDADGARAQRATSRRRSDTTARASGSRIRSSRAQGLACNPTSGGAGCFANNIIPAESHQLDRPADAEHVPAAERHRSDRSAAVQLPDPDAGREAAE